MKNILVNGRNDSNKKSNSFFYSIVDKLGYEKVTPYDEYHTTIYSIKEVICGSLLVSSIIYSHNRGQACSEPH